MLVAESISLLCRYCPPPHPSLSIVPGTEISWPLVLGGLRGGGRREIGYGHGSFVFSSRSTHDW